MAMIALGEGLYVIRKNTTMARELVISSHGAHLGIVGGTIEVPAWTQLNFFTPHGTVLQDPGVGPLISGRIMPSEVKGRGDTVQNYRLSKYQGSHNRAGETYDSIEKTLSKSKWDVDVLTIRNRWWLFGAGVTLGYVLSKLSEAGN